MSHALMSSHRAAVAAALIALTAATASAAVTVVTPDNLGTPSDPQAGTGWFFYNDETDTIDNTLGTFVAGPDTPPMNSGSVQISVSGTQRRNLATYQFSGTPLADITALRFSTYNPSIGNGGSATRSAYLQFNVDFNGTDTWQRRLVFLPSRNGAVIQDLWQEWDAIQGGSALWQYSGATWPGGGSGSTPKTWAQILAQYPGVRIRVTDSFVGLRVGEPYPDGYTENLDAFELSTTSTEQIFDFELALPRPTDKDQCKDDGWRLFTDPPYRNQGDCISDVLSRRD